VKTEEFPHSVADSVAAPQSSVFSSLFLSFSPQRDVFLQFPNGHSISDRILIGDVGPEGPNEREEASWAHISPRALPIFLIAPARASHFLNVLLFYCNASLGPISQLRPHRFPES